MIRRLLLALILCGPIALGLETVVEPKERMTRNILFLLDTSGSMRAGPLTKAVGAVIEIATQATDDLNVGVLAFADGTARWPGVPKTEPDGGPPDGWAAMPSQKNAEKLGEWLKGFTGNGGTNLAPALREALAEKQPRKGNLTIVIVTDDRVSDQQKAILGILVQEGQEAREKAGLGKAILVGYSIGKGDEVSSLGIIVNVGPCGGFFREAD